MKIYVVFHADLEDDRYTRYVFADKELAEAACSLDEVTYYPPSDTPSRRTHHEHCCFVETFEVLESWPEVEHGPDVKFKDPPPPLPWYLKWMMERMLEPNPPLGLMSKDITVTIVAQKIDTVEEIAEDDKGIHVQAKLR